MQQTAADQDRVTIAFTGKLDNGALFIEVTADQPMTLVLGDTQLPPTVEATIIGMEVGETRKVRVDPDEGYGPRIKSLLHDVPRTTFAERFEPQAGMLISQKVEHEGQQRTVPATIIAVTDETVTIDYNHPLAGHHLTYELTVLAINRPA